VLNRLWAPLSGSDPDSLLHVEHEDLAVADLALSPVRAAFAIRSTTRSTISDLITASIFSLGRSEMLTAVPR